MRYDFAIIGGGLAGATLALALSRMRAQSSARLRILLLERKAMPSPRGDVVDARAIAISVGSLHALADLGITDIFTANDNEIKKIHISDAGYMGRVFLSAEDYRLPYFGKVFSLSDFESELYKRISHVESGIELVFSSSVVSISNDSLGKIIVTDSGKMYQAKTVLISEGGDNKLCQSFGVEYIRKDFSQTAIVTSIRFSHSIPNLAWERFTASGPLAILPMGDNLYSIVWTVNAVDAARLIGLDKVSFINELQQAFGFRAGKIIMLGNRQSFPLHQSIAANVVIDPNLILFGNAAHMIHPVAGQGFNLTVRDIYQFVAGYAMKTLSADPLSITHLMQEYNRTRMSDVNDVVYLTSSLINIFCASSFLVAHARSFSLLAMARNKLLRRLTVQAGAHMKISSGLPSVKYN